METLDVSLFFSWILNPILHWVFLPWVGTYIPSLVSHEWHIIWRWNLANSYPALVANSEVIKIANVIIFDDLIKVWVTWGFLHYFNYTHIIYWPTKRQYKNKINKCKIKAMLHKILHKKLGKIKEYWRQESPRFLIFDDSFWGCDPNTPLLVIFFGTSRSLFLLNFRKYDQISASKSQYFQSYK